MIERERTFDCFGARVTVRASGEGRSGLGSPAALLLAEALLLEVHDRLTPFAPGSELSRLNASPRAHVPAGAIARRLAAAVRPAGLLSGGLVDATAPGSDADVHDGWKHVRVDPARGAVVRPFGVRIDPCGIAKGMAADLVAARLEHHPSFLVDCLGDLRTGGTLRLPRPVRIADPFGSSTAVATLWLIGGAAATSGTTKRPGQLLDPRTREPADTGIVQATALAPTGLEAETRAKAALLAGPARAADHLSYGGALVLAGGAIVEIPGIEVEPARGTELHRSAA